MAKVPAFVAFICKRTLSCAFERGLRSSMCFFSCGPLLGCLFTTLSGPLNHCWDLISRSILKILTNIDIFMQAVMNNGSLWAHAFFARSGYSPNPEDASFERGSAFSKTFRKCIVKETALNKPLHQPKNVGDQSCFLTSCCQMLDSGHVTMSQSPELLLSERPRLENGIGSFPQNDSRRPQTDSSGGL